jgi:hypothetical protein
MAALAGGGARQGIEQPVGAAYFTQQVDQRHQAKVPRQHFLQTVLETNWVYLYYTENHERRPRGVFIVYPARNFEIFPRQYNRKFFLILRLF